MRARTSITSKNTVGSRDGRYGQGAASQIGNSTQMTRSNQQVATDSDLSSLFESPHGTPQVPPRKGGSVQLPTAKEGQNLNCALAGKSAQKNPKNLYSMCSGDDTRNIFGDVSTVTQVEYHSSTTVMTSTANFAHLQRWVSLAEANTATRSTLRNSLLQGFGGCKLLCDGNAPLRKHLQELPSLPQLVLLMLVPSLLHTAVLVLLRELKSSLLVLFSMSCLSLRNHKSERFTSGKGHVAFFFSNSPRNSRKPTGKRDRRSSRHSWPALFDEDDIHNNKKTSGDQKDMRNTPHECSRQGRTGPAQK